MVEEIHNSNNERMSMKTKIALALLAAAASPGALAGVTTVPRPLDTITTTTVIPGTADKTVNRGYAGLKWDIPGPLAPTLVVGVRRAKVESDGDTSGADLSFGLSFAGGVKPEKLRLKGFMGKERVQGEIGVGWDFAAASFFAGPSVNFPYVNLGVDWLSSSGLKPYALIHTMGKYDKPVGSTTVTTSRQVPGACPAGFIPDSDTICVLVTPPPPPPPPLG
jgi:hypothetical protein